MINDQKHLVGQLRSLLSENNTNLRLRNGVWKITDRRSGWQEAGKHIFDEHLDRIKDIAVSVLQEPNPKYNMPPENRMFCQEKPKYSTALRKGLAETLAQIGSCSEHLTHVSQGKPHLTSLLAVRGLLENADWVHWASVDDLLPMLAEACPEEFMTQVEAALLKEASPFQELFQQERDAFSGGTLMCGLLWALESLAWSPEHLHRVIAILGKLASIDPGGKWSNRPANSIIEILVPWLPHTCAPAEIRISAVKALLKNVPEVGWKVLLSLLPNGHSTTSCTNKPKWRDFAEGWQEGVTVKERWDQHTAYAEIAVDIALSDFNKLLQILKKISDLPRSTWDVLEHNLRENNINFSIEQKKLIWESLLSVTLRHRKFSDAKWAMPISCVERLESIEKEFEPQSAFLQHQPLFSDGDFDLFDGPGSYEEKSERLFQRRIDAVRSVYEEGGQKLLFEFCEKISDHFNFGRALGASNIPVLDKEIIISGWMQNELNRTNFVLGFIMARFKKRGWPWVDELNMQEWELPIIGKTLARLPFSNETWQRVSKLMGDNQSPYWQNTLGNHWDAGEHLNEGIEKFIKYGCPAKAIDCVAFLKPPLTEIQVNLAVQALETMLATKKSDQRFDAYDAVQVIGFLQESEFINSESLAKIEWGYLRILNSHNNSAPKQLEIKLSEEPMFFCEILRLIYRSSHDTAANQETISEEKKAVATNAWHLLHEWRRVPGTDQNGGINKKGLDAWIVAVEGACSESGHYDVAQICIGHVLRYSPPDPGGLWIHKAVAEILDRMCAANVRQGYECEWFNSRGVHGYTHGNEERKIAEGFRQNALSAEQEGFINLATTMRNLARSYERDAEREEKNDPFGDL